MFVVISAAIAAQVESPTLQPRALIDRTFTVNANVLGDPVQESNRSALMLLLPSDPVI